MADKRDQWADSFSAEPQGGWLTGFLAEETKGTRRLMWRLGSWGVAAVGAVTLAVLASQYEIQLRRDQFAAADALNRQEQQLQRLTKEAQAENRRLSQAIDTLNGDRDRLFSRVTLVEKGLESATGSILARQTLPMIPPREPAPQIAAPTTQPAPSTIAEPKVASAPPDLPSVPTKPLDGAASDTTAKIATEQAPPKSNDAPAEEPAKTVAAESNPVQKAPETAPLVQMAAVTTPPIEVATPVARTEFGVDIGTANSIDGLRALWRGLSKTPALNGLRPIIVVRERSNGLGMQLRLVAGPLTDAAAAARICATLTEGKRSCETSIFDGQRLVLKNEVESVEKPVVVAPAPAKPARPAPPRRAAPKPEPAVAPKPEQRSEQPPPKPAEEAQVQAPKPTPSFSALLGFTQE
jgi:outer membrane biosynthesis protein TonB